jgi:uncharacterized protein
MPASRAVGIQRNANPNRLTDRHNSGLAYYSFFAYYPGELNGSCAKQLSPAGRDAGDQCRQARRHGQTNCGRKLMKRECTRCGKCCTNERYMSTLWATEEDVKRWIAQRRWDILAWVHIFWRGNQYPETYFESEPTSADLWISPITGNEHSRCPFVRKDPNRPTYRCMIYDTRPQVCRDYEPWTPGTICEEVEQIESSK